MYCKKPIINMTHNNNLLPEVNLNCMLVYITSVQLLYYDFGACTDIVPAFPHHCDEIVVMLKFGCLSCLCPDHVNICS